MFLFKRPGVGNRASLHALRALYRSFIEENGPEARARRLLREWLSPDQRAQFDAEGYFESHWLAHPAADIEFTMAP